MDECTLESIIRPTEIETLHFVNAGNSEGQKEMYYNNKRLVEFIAWARENYDMVIFDTPAAIYIPDIVDFFEYIDGILVIVRLRRTTRSMLNRLFKVLNVFSSKHITTILNDFDEKQGKGYGDYGYTSNSYYENSSDDSNNSNLKKKRPRRSIIFIIIFAILSVLMLGYFWKSSLFSHNSKSKSGQTVSNVIDKKLVQ
jgi:Mrp family chromosome partitioning ATPase